MNSVSQPSSDGVDLARLDESLVYQELADIRSSFEKLIDRYGFESIEDIMPKVVTVLEQFEELASYRRQAKLKLANSELRLEEAREIHASEMRQQRARLNELQEHCVILQEENCELRRRIKNPAQSMASKNALQQQDASGQHEEMMLKLSDVIAAQQRKINEMREEYDVLNQHNNKQSTIVLKLKTALQETMHAQRVLQSRNDTLCSELANLEASIAAQELKGDYNFRERSDSCTQSEDRSWDSFEELRKRDESIPEDPDIVTAKKEYKRSATQVIRDTLSSYSPATRRKNKCTCEQSKYRFSVDEMTLLINERNILKEKVCSLEEDLSYCKEQGDIEDGFEILEPPERVPSSAQGALTRTLFKRISQNDVSKET